jgi:acyl carrier protein
LKETENNWSYIIFVRFEEKMSLPLNEIETFLDFTSSELSISKNSISLETRFRDIPSWSSLNALIYISRINEETNVLITSGDLSEIVNLGDIYKLIKERSNGYN